MKIAMPSPNNTNHAQLFIDRPVVAAYDSAEAAFEPRKVTVMNDASVVKEAIMRARIMVAFDGAADDLDMQSAMDTLRRVASKTSKQEWDSIYDSMGRDSFEISGHVPPQNMMPRGLHSPSDREPPTMMPKGEYDAQYHTFDASGFNELFGAEPMRVDNYGIAAPSTGHPMGASQSCATTTDIASFHELYGV
jgi:hypothetical protein